MLPHLECSFEVLAPTLQAFSTDDCRVTYKELRDRGVEFTEEPTERPYGIDAAFGDQSGNPFGVVQERAMVEA